MSTWQSWLNERVGALIVLGIMAAVSVAIVNEGRLSELEGRMVLMESGQSTPISNEARQRFIAVEASIEHFNRDRELLNEKLSEIIDRLSRIEGSLLPPRKGNTLQSPVLRGSREALPAWQPLSPDVNAATSPDVGG